MSTRASHSPRFTFTKLFAALSLVFLLRVAAGAAPVVALIDINTLVTFDSASPGTIISSGTITGLPVGERIVAIDFRPATGQLYGLGRNFNRLYIINPSTRVAVQTVGSAPLNPPLNDSDVGFDFDPTRDRIRITVDDATNRQNLLVTPHPQTGGQATVDTPPEFAPGDANAGQLPRLYGLAYDNNFAGATHARLYAIHRSNTTFVPTLVTVAPGNGGQIQTVGVLTPFTVTNELGFDIAPVGGVAYVAMKANSATIIRSQVYSVSLVTGAATFLGDIGQNGRVLDLAVVPPQFVVHAVNGKNEMIKFNAAYPETILSRAPITGMLAGEQMHELDFSPTGGLFGLGRTNGGSTSRVYTVNTDTGAASVVSGAPLDPAPAGGDMGFDFFNPDGFGLIRIVTQTGQNLRLDPVTGNVQFVEPSLAYAPGDPNAGRNPNVVAAANDNSYPGVAEAGLASPDQAGNIFYDIDRANPLDPSGTLLVRHGPLSGFDRRDSGQLFTVGQITGVGLPVDFIGFDIAHGGPALATFISMDDGFSKLYVLDLATGGAAFLSAVDASNPDFDAKRLRDLAVAPAGMFGFDENVYEVVEDCTAVTVTVTRTGDTTNEATVDFETIDSTGRFGASSRSDYTAVRGTLFFAAGQTSATFNVPINEDSLNETGTDDLQPFAGESFLVGLSNPTDGFTLFIPPGNTRPLAGMFIRDDGDTGVGNANDDTQTFVCQHYHDFLSRQPEPAGIAFWSNVIESCGADAQCREVRRVNVSAAFFLSIEFQETGYLVYRAYQAAFGRAPVPVRLGEFTPDTQAIGRGVVVGQGNWQERLEANKRAFFDDFVMRAPFKAQYPASLTATQFVDALNANTGGSLSPAERDDLVARLGDGRINRAQALRAVSDDADFRQREFNRAFVLMQYFGYLRRNPDDIGFNGQPDPNFDGYNFWLNRLNQFNGNFVRAEMVKAFIQSIEYRRRFGQ